MILEGRFGNSIRFGSTNISDKVGTPNEWSNVGKLSDPITIIRNGQSDNLEKKGWIHAKEDIMGDASSIYMTSNQQLSNFSPSSLNQKSFGANLVEIPTIQEQLTVAIHNAMHTIIEDNAGVAVMIDATHNCVQCRGVKHGGATMKTSKLTGAFKDDSATRHEFYEFVKGY